MGLVCDSWWLALDSPAYPQLSTLVRNKYMQAICRALVYSKSRSKLLWYLLDHLPYLKISQRDTVSFRKATQNFKKTRAKSEICHRCLIDNQARALKFTCPLASSPLAYISRSFPGSPPLFSHTHLAISSDTLRESFHLLHHTSKHCSTFSSSNTLTFSNSEFQYRSPP